MMVVEDGDQPVANGMVTLTGTDVDGEYGMYGCEDQEVQLVLEKAAEAKGGQTASSAIVFFFLTVFWAREVRLGSGQRFAQSVQADLRVKPTSISFSSSSLVRRMPPASSLRRYSSVALAA